MKQASVRSYCLIGNVFLPVTVEVTIRPGLPGIELTGNPGKDIQEGVARLSSGIRASGFSWPKGKISICVSPPTQKKNGAMLDLPIAVAILKADRQIIVNQSVVVLGGVGLTGNVLPFRQVDLLMRTCAKDDFGYLIPDSMRESFRKLHGTRLYALTRLTEVRNDVRKVSEDFIEEESVLPESFLIDKVVGQAHAKRALHIAMAGGIPLLFTGSSGVGKTMLSMAAAELLGSLTCKEEQQQVQAYAKFGLPLPMKGVRSVVQPPTHTTVHQLFTKHEGLVGGYVALAETGVLFLDELPERGKEVVDSLRQFLETPELGVNYRSRVIAAQNTCFCGRYGDTAGSCTCTAADLAKYQRTFSEAVYQRFPLSCFLKNEIVPKEYISGKDMRDSILHMRVATLAFSDEVRHFLEAVSQKKHYSLRTQRNLLRVAKTIADLGGKKSVATEDISEALTFMYKPLNL
ncbi:YifB family Mg chelatase-like AAA ATPase [soil metagenome]